MTPIISSTFTHQNNILNEQKCKEIAHEYTKSMSPLEKESLSFLIHCLHFAEQMSKHWNTIPKFENEENIFQNNSFNRESLSTILLERNTSASKNLITRFIDVILNIIQHPYKTKTSITVPSNMTKFLNATALKNGANSVFSNIAFWGDLCKLTPQQYSEKYPQDLPHIIRTHKIFIDAYEIVHKLITHRADESVYQSPHTPSKFFP